MQDVAPESVPSADGLLSLRVADGPGAEGGSRLSPPSHCWHEGAAQSGPLTPTRCVAIWLVVPFDSVFHSI